MSDGAAPVCFVDVETTGLDADRHQVWEAALITPDGVERVWQFPVRELDADPKALDVGRFWDRRAAAPGGSVPRLQAALAGAVVSGTCPYHVAAGQLGEWAEAFRDLTAGAHLAGAVVSFDEERLRRLLLAAGFLPRWHYHLVDVEALAAGWLAGLHADHARGEVARACALAAAGPPWRSDDLSLRVGVDPADFDRHTALGDARWARAVYREILG